MRQGYFAFDKIKLDRISIKEASKRIYHSGAHSLSNLELLTSLIRDPKAAYNLIAHYDNDLHSIGLAGIDELSKIKGIGRAKAEIIKASFEFSQRAQVIRKNDVKIKEAKDIADLVMPKMRHLEQEYFKVASLNGKLKLLAITTIFVGTLDVSLVHPREVFKEALRRTAKNIILIHNHPSGNSEPSKEDIEITKRIAQAGKLLGIEVLDHIIIGDGEFISMKEKDLIKTGKEGFILS